MKLKSFNNFLKSESGAVTVDWVVLTAALVGMAFLVLGIIASGIGSNAHQVEPEMVAAPGVGANLVVAN